MRVIVIGAGILGANAAFHLARAGAEVTVLDPLLEGRATAAGAGIVCPWPSARTDPGWYGFATAAARHYPTLIEALAAGGETDTGYRRSGALVLPGPDGTLEAAEARILARLPDAPEAGTLSRLAPQEARALFPALNPDLPALHLTGGARVDGRRLAAALLRDAERHGARRIADPALDLVTTGGRVTGVLTPDARLEADEVLLCAGAWAPPLLSALNLGLNVQPQRGQIAHFHLQGQDTAAWPVLLPQSGHYMLAFEGSRIVAGATRETGSGFDPRLTAAGAKEVLDNALALAPGLANATLLEFRIGLRPAGPDLAPQLGRAPGWEGLTIGNALGPSGLTLGPLAGALLADLVLGRPPSLDLAPYAPFPA
ncbi:NAD(P)/FAD-dependent oxidoreductase [Pararoseomonas indoligenes]|uniref:FAD-dependent oxidoreductase n=1 Tax=Roseomonas indoligenes TaxID=2820811 RepID=A0A940N052_9PROT|nr:FAD-dependent oxidoreductase [Pararoseomonas indoligenes]MBP0493651.1 FAD-dependent oxidoreductase [Pararoseomonas indoligenes]